MFRVVVVLIAIGLFSLTGCTPRVVAPQMKTDAEKLRRIEKALAPDDESAEADNEVESGGDGDDAEPEEDE